jgi:hypothetical protein
MNPARAEMIAATPCRWIHPSDARQSLAAFVAKRAVIPPMTADFSTGWTLSARRGGSKGHLAVAARHYDRAAGGVNLITWCRSIHEGFA